MKITYIKLFNNKKRDESVLMKHLRDENNRFITNEKSIKNRNNTFFQQLFKDSKKIIKKNQVVLVATSLMLVTAGYLNYTNNIKIAALGDAQLVSTNVTESEEIEENVTESNDEEEIIETQGQVLNEEQTAQTAVTNNDKTQQSQNNKNNDYFTKTKLERETMYSQMLETYQKILENNNIPNDQKSIASNEIKNINDKKSAISTIENLIKIKGFDDLAILINGNSVNVVVKSTSNLEPNQVAQIQNIVSRELETDIEDIHITTHG